MLTGSAMVIPAFWSSRFDVQTDFPMESFHCVRWFSDAIPILSSSLQCSLANGLVAFQSAFCLIDFL